MENKYRPGYKALLTSLTIATIPLPPSASAQTGPSSAPAADTPRVSTPAIRKQVFPTRSSASPSSTFPMTTGATATLPTHTTTSCSRALPKTPSPPKSP